MAIVLDLDEADETIDTFDELVRQRDALRAENAMLRQDVINLAKGYEDRIIELRAALEGIEGISHTSLLPDRVVEIVTNVLEPERAARGRSAS